MHTIPARDDGGWIVAPQMGGPLGGGSYDKIKRLAHFHLLGE